MAMNTTLLAELVNAEHVLDESTLSNDDQVKLRRLTAMMVFLDQRIAERHEAGKPAIREAHEAGALRWALRLLMKPGVIA
jgi:hypothetical protein